eukprot:1642676-Rhodomonas_salina.2
MADDEGYSDEEFELENEEGHRSQEEEETKLIVNKKESELGKQSAVTEAIELVDLKGDELENDHEKFKLETAASADGTSVDKEKDKLTSLEKAEKIIREQQRRGESARAKDASLRDENAKIETEKEVQNKTLESKTELDSLLADVTKMETAHKEAAASKKREEEQASKDDAYDDDFEDTNSVEDGGAAPHREHRRESVEVAPLSCGLTQQRCAMLTEGCALLPRRRHPLAKCGSLQAPPPKQRARQVIAALCLRIKPINVVYRGLIG